jgi:hypothetical protein
VSSIELLKPASRALLPELLEFGFTEPQEAHCISEHDPLNLGIIVSDGSQEKDHQVGKWSGGEQFREALLLRDHRPVGAVEQPLVASGKMLFESLHAFDDFPTGTRLENFAERADVGVHLGRTGQNLSYRPLPTFVDVVLRTRILHGFVEVAEMSQIDSELWKRVLFDYICPENRICPTLIVTVRTEAMAGMGHDWHTLLALHHV